MYIDKKIEPKKYKGMW